MKWLSFILLLLIAGMQHPLWRGEASWSKVMDKEQELASARSKNLLLQNRNNKLEAEVNDLKQGFEAIEEHARSDLGMIKEGEILFQIVRNTQSNLSQSDSAQ